MVKEKNTERIIMQAARKVFVTKGMHGARMQEIADEAGINKALLHYYFRNKSKLFEAIFQQAFQEIAPKFGQVIRSKTSLEEKIRSFVAYYHDLLSENPFIPLFIINEVHQNKSLLDGPMELFQENLKNHMGRQLEEGIKAGKYRDISIQQLMISTVSLCIMPFLGKPIFEVVLSCKSEEYQQLLEERKTLVPEMILQYLILNKS